MFESKSEQVINYALNPEVTNLSTGCVVKSSDAKRLDPIDIAASVFNRTKDHKLPTQYQSFIHISRYSRWLDEAKRRETWPETVYRYCEFFDKRFDRKFADVIWNQIYPAILNLEILPSMRALMSAGEALERENVAGYNCSYIAVRSKRHFAETLYILMNGTGVGFSCERQDIAKLPAVPDELNNVDDVIVVADSKAGWAKAYHKLINALWEGDIPVIDYSKVRPAGARLKTFGGRASGPAPLKRLFEFTINTFKGAKGRRLESIEVHDIMCMIGEVVVVGGVRRSALISLSNLSDLRMRNAKQGQFWIDNPQRSLANNSVAYTEKPDAEIFMEEWLSLVKSKSGERGIFNRQAAQKQASKWGRRSATAAYGTNPCSEIILLSEEFCNLTTNIIRAEDTEESMLRKIELSTILGTMQATLTKFGFLSEGWVRNTKDEALLGVSLNGVMDNDLFSGRLGHDKLAKTLENMREHARVVNKKWAALLGINESAATTCIKPEGTSSQMVWCGPGMHSWHGKCFWRTVRIDKKDPLYQFLKDSGLRVEDDLRKPDSTAVIYFPMKAPDGAALRKDFNAIQMLELWLLYQRHYCEHKPSITVDVRDHEWLKVGAWVYEHFDEISGVSFLPTDDHIYEQEPYIEMTEEEYNKVMKETPPPVLDWFDLSKYEDEDNTVSSQNFACVAGACELT